MISIMRKMFDLLTSREKVQLYLILIAMICLAFIEMAGIASILPFIAVVANPEVVQTNLWLKRGYDFFGFTNSHNFLIFLGALVLCLLVFSNLFKAITTWMTLRFDNRLNFLLARRLLAAYLAQPYIFFLNRNTAEMGKNILNEVRTVIAGILSPGMQVISSSLVSVSILSLLLIVNPLIALTISIVLGGIYVILYLVVRRIMNILGKEQVEAGFLKFKTASEALSGIKDIKVLGRERVFLDRFSFQAQRHARNNITVGVISQVPRHFLEVMAFGGILCIILYYLGHEQGAAHIVPLLALYAFAGYRLLPAFQQVFSSVASVRYNLAALNVLHRDLVQNRPDGLQSLLDDPAIVAPLPFQRALELKDVSYFYPEAKEPAIQDVNISILSNSTIGFVGATGSGKTTIVDILLGLLNPTSGTLVVDDIVIEGHDSYLKWQLNLGYVPQNIYLCDDTVTRNIAFGISEQDIDMAAVVRAAKISNLSDFIESELPEGYDTVIGERGVRLSGGQRQRIGIARSLYRDPGVLIMDEATSALDGLTEEAVMDAMRKLARKKTIIIIAHRLTTVKDCDIIYLLQHGRIVDQGTYSELMKSSEWFKSVTKAGT